MKAPIFPLASLAIALGLAGSIQAQTADGTTTATSAQQALVSAMGDKAKDIAVEVSQGKARLQGWAQQPGDVDQARYIVSQLPGITRAISTQVRTWSTTDR
jgi:osmotically-inducible protein OsmY